LSFIPPFFSLFLKPYLNLTYLNLTYLNLTYLNLTYLNLTYLNLTYLNVIPESVTFPPSDSFYTLFYTARHCTLRRIFLRKVDISRAWGLEYSPVIYHEDRASTSGRPVSFHQSLYHVGLL
jgi:hypothetical protein